MSTKIRSKKAYIRAKAVGTTPILLCHENPNRAGLLVYNNGTATVYILPTETHPIVEGIPVAAGASYENDTLTGELYIVAESGTQDVRIEEDTD